MTDLKAGTMLVMEHPVMIERHVVARVYGAPTAKMVRVQYWNRAARDWNGEHVARQHRAVVAILPEGAEPADVTQQLERAATALTNGLRAARRQYNARIKVIAAGVGA